ncbi:hypothetical protein KC726_03750 [Candidatus Woesebacteria bacterium]|nr:hypothetical protein [Candidatus Woesebacteria bacterium]
MAANIIEPVLNVFSKIKKTAIVVIVFLAIINLFLYFNSGQKIKLDNHSQEYLTQEIYKNLNEYKEDKSIDGQLKYITYQSSNCLLLGEGCNPDPNNPSNNSQGLVGFMASAMTIPLTHPPASGIQWTQNTLAKAGFLPKTYAAQGIGFTSIQGYIGIWTAFRNLSFLLLVLVMVTIGFLIMFQVRMNPQTTVSLQNALPKIVVTMLLITFSFAIAGFLIDIMYTVMTLSISILFDVNKTGYAATSTTLQDLQLRYQTARMGDLWPSPRNGAIWASAFALINVLPDTFRLVLQFVISPLVGIGFAYYFGEFPNKIITAFNNIGALSFNVGQLPKLAEAVILVVLALVLVPIIVPFILGVILLLTALFFMFRVFFMLLGAYINIVLMIVFGPIILMFGAVPGRDTFGWWFKNLFAELLTFPLIVILMMVGRVIIDYNAGSNYFQLPFLYGIDNNSMGFLIAFGVVLLIPNFIQIMKKSLGAEGTGLNVGPGLYFGGAGAIAGGALGLYSGQLSTIKRILVGHNPYESTPGILGRVNPQRQGGESRRERLVKWIQGLPI